MMSFFFLCIFQTTYSQVFTLDENLICNDMSCNQGSYASNLYNYGQEKFGDLSGCQFSFQFFIRIDSQIASSSGQGFIASIMVGTQVILDLRQKTTNSFQINNQGNPTQFGSFQSSSWFQIYITESSTLSYYIDIYIQDWSMTSIYTHSITFTSSHRFNLFTQSSTDYWTGIGCCIIMYKGIFVDNKYFNNQFYIQVNTKQPETIIDLNVQEKIQSNITYDYSDYQNIIRMGNSFDFDQSDPYLLDDLLFFNGSQYLNIYDIQLNYQYTIEFRMKLSALTSDIQLFQFQSLSYFIMIKLKPSLILEFNLNGQLTQFTLTQQSQLHFCVAIIYFMDETTYKYIIQFIQFSNSGSISQQSQLLTSPTQFYIGQGTITIGSLLNQFNSGEYFELYHFRFYQGYFIDDMSFIDTSCQIYLNDKCIICKSGYLLQDNNICLSQCSQLQKTTYFNQKHNQCLRQCHTQCATCSRPTICLTCYGNRQNPPYCTCPAGYFEDYVSPNCRKYYQDQQTQTGQMLVQCSSVGNLCNTVSFDYLYNVDPKIGLFLVGASQNTAQIRINMWVSSQSHSGFQFCTQCNTAKQFYQIQWISSISSSFFKAQEGDQNNMNSNLINIPITNQQNYQVYPQILGWKQPSIGSAFSIQVQNQISNQFQIQSLNPIDFIKYNIVYTNFLTQQYQISTQSQINIDNIPKSIKIISLFQGLQTTNNTGTFNYMIQSRKIDELTIYSRLPITNLNGQLLFTAQQCQTGACDFYQHYLANCNLNFQQCSCSEANYFINSNNVCDKCDQNCYSCSGTSTYCTQCQGYQNKQLVNGQCVCGAKKYLDINNICRDCDILCSSCIVASSNCQACISNSQLQNGSCVCNAGMYLDLIQQSCQDCHQNCKTCIGGAINQCLTCESDKIYNQQLMTCQCRDSQFLDQNYICVDCHSTCSQCIQSSYTDCISCSNLRTLVINDLTFFRECICQSDYYQDDTGDCQQCHPSCSECQNALTCLQCSSTRQFDEKTKQCICNLGYFEQVSEQTCIKCSSNCSFCINQIICLNCVNNTEIINFVCKCKQGFYLDNETCLSCNSNAGLLQKTCWNNVCGDGLKTNSEECDDGNSLDGDGCNNLCFLEKGYQLSNQLIIKINYPSAQLIESQQYQNIYVAQREYTVSFMQELLQFESKMENFIDFRIQSKILNQDYTFNLIDNSQLTEQGIRINATIQLYLYSTFIDQRLEILFNNTSKIRSLDGFPLQVNFIDCQISDFVYVDYQTISITDNFTNSTYYMLYFLLGLVVLSLLTGGIEIFYNLLDLLQVISYLQYVNTQFPYNLETYLNLFSFLQFKILNDYVDISKYIVDYSQLYTSPPKINDDGISPNIIVNLSAYMTIWLIFFTTIALTYVIPFAIKLVNVQIKSQDNMNDIQYKTLVMTIKYFIVRLCKDIQNESFYSGFFRTYLSTAYDFCFYLSLNLYFLSFDDYEINEVASYITIIWLFIYFVILVMSLDVVSMKSYSLIMNKQKFGSIYEGLILKNRYFKYFNLYLLLKRLLFMIFLVLPYSDPLFQITGLIALQTIQVAFLSIKPLKEQSEQYKQMLCEILMLVIELNIFILVLDDAFTFVNRSTIGWICIITITLLLSSQILFDTAQQLAKIRQIYRKLQKCITYSFKGEPNNENILVQV